MATTYDSEIPADYRWTQWVVFILSTFGIGALVYWGTGMHAKTVECLGSQQIGISAVSDDTTVVALPMPGSEHYAIAVGPTCKDLKMEEKAFSANGNRKVCVGNDLKQFGAGGDVSDCKVLSITQIPVGKAAALLDKRT